MGDKQPIQVETSSDRDAKQTLTFVLFLFIMVTFWFLGAKLGEVFDWRFEGGAEPGALIGLVTGLIVSLFIRPIREMLIILTVLGAIGAGIYYLYAWMFS